MEFYERNTSGLNADRFMSKFDDNTLANVQRHYWTARQFIRSKLGKKEDSHLEASDEELDTCLNSYRCVHATSTQLLTAFDNYAVFLFDATLVQNMLGKYLKEKGKTEKTENIRKSLIAAGRCLLFSSHQLNAVRTPVNSFVQKFHVFVDRAIGDCAQTVEAVEMARTEYRGSLLWMKKTSDELDPESQESMEKFREAQTTVRFNKERLDKLKTDTLQKVDLLGASRSNLLATILTGYQSTLASYYSQTAKAFETLADNISSYNDYEFEVLSHLLTNTEKREVEQQKVEKEKEESSEKDDSVKELLFGRESPLFEMQEDERDEHCDSPLCDIFESDEPGPSTTGNSLNIGPLATLFSAVPIPPIAPPPEHFGKVQRQNSKTAESNSTNAGNSNKTWEQFLLDCDLQQDDNLI